MYDKEETVIGKALNKGDLAIKFIMPQDIDYATEKQKEHISDYLLIDYHHVYSDDNNNVNMNYAYTNVTGNYKNDGFFLVIHVDGTFIPRVILVRVPLCSERFMKSGVQCSVFLYI